jgi:hypothetical protein
VRSLIFHWDAALEIKNYPFDVPEVFNPAFILPGRIFFSIKIFTFKNAYLRNSKWVVNQLGNSHPLVSRPLEGACSRYAQGVKTSAE